MPSENLRKPRKQCQVIQKIDSNKTRNVQVNVTLRHIRVNIVAVKSNKYYILCVCVCSLVIEHAERRRTIVFSFYILLTVHPGTIRVNNQLDAVL